MVALRSATALVPLAVLVFVPLVGIPSPAVPDLPPVLPWLARPGAAAALWLYYAFDPSPALFATVALLMHATASFLLARLVERLFPPRAALLAGLVYAVHPLQAETLATPALAAALPGILLLLASIHCHLSGRAAAAWLAACGALLFEPAAAILPLAIFLIARGTPAGRRLAWFSAASLALWSAQLLGSGAELARAWPWLGVFVLRSLFQFFFPLGMTPAPDLRTSPWQAAAAMLATAIAAALALTASRRGAAGAWLLAAIALLASVYLLPALPQQPSMALPLLALAPSAAIVLADADPRLAAVYVSVFGLLAFSFARQWRDPAGLGMEAVRMAPERLDLRISLAPYLPPVQALELALETRRKWPRDPRAAVTAGDAFLRAGRPHEALAEFDHALSLAPGNAAALTGRAAAWLALDRPEAARGELRRALAAGPCYLPAWILAIRLGEQPPDSRCPFTRAQRRALALATSRRGSPPSRGETASPAARTP